MLFTAHKDATVDYDGTEIKEFNKEFDSQTKKREPFRFS